LNYSDIPKTIKENIEFRKVVDGQAKGNPRVQAYLREACKSDVRIYINLFMWTIDPRRRDIRKLPFITYDFQDDGLLALTESIGREPVGIEKSRGVGWTWTVLPFFDWRCRFFEWESFGVMSRKEELVDSASGGVKTLFGKLDFIRQYLPTWLRPSSEERTSRPATYINHDTSASMHGESLTPDAWRQDRMTAILIDEHASYAGRVAKDLTAAISGATDCPIFLSTHRGRGTEFYRQVRGESPGRVLTHGWWQHPEQKKGLYYVDTDGNVELRDDEFWNVATVRDLRRRYPRVCRNKIEPRTPLDALAKKYYPFNAVGPNTDERSKLRSPYYDEKCCELGARKLIAMELDIDPIGSGDEYFDAIEIERLLGQCREPDIIGTLSVDPYTAEPEGFLQSNAGLFKMWLSLAADGLPPYDKYVIGADVAAGTKATPSCMTIGSAAKGVVATFAGNQISPTQFGTLLVGTSRWFHRATIIYEAQGPGESTTHRIKELNYPHVFRDPTTKRDIGVWATGYARQAWLEMYAKALGNSEFVNPDRDSILECNDFEWRNGRIVHRGEVDTDDEGSKGKQHGDRVTSAALCWWGLRQIVHAMDRRQRDADRLTPRNPAKWSQAWYEQQAMIESRTGRALGNTYGYGLNRSKSVFAN